MLQTTIMRAPISAQSLDSVAHSIKARDQRRELVIGDVISYYHDEDSNDEEVQVTIWHNRGRAAVCFCNGDSEWGDWNEDAQTILMDDPDAHGQRVTLDRYGRQCGR